VVVFGVCACVWMFGGGGLIGLNRLVVNIATRTRDRPSNMDGGN